MATGKISKRSVDGLAPNGTKQFLWDSELRGFGLQMTPSGALSYIYQYRTGGRESPKRRYTIGRHGSPWTPASARAECERLALLVAQGADPALVDRARRREAVDLAFTAYIDTFSKGYLRRRWKDWKGAERLLERAPAEVLRDKPLPLITRADIIAVLDRLHDKPAVARLTYATLRKLFSWAEGRGEIERSPLGAGFPAPQAVPARDRVLSDAELALVWGAAEKIGYPFGPMYQLLLLTGARRDEVSGLNWSELDRKARQWVLPADRAKNGQTHIVPLSDPAMSVLDALAKIDLPEGAEVKKWPASGHVLTTNGETSVSGYSGAKRRLDKAMAKAAQDDMHIAPWRTHDIRRTVATGLQRLGIRFEVTEAILNHVSGSRGGVAGVYQRHDWLDEKRAALSAWADRIREIAAGKAAVPIDGDARDN